ncbi:pre-RNA processing PIH1/Nop17-domain-containing protein [Catenaria anguillulae PL171]|uniref:Pre-RNA processing PIH1/Nop17-domain-containing protein n=1 Tax=Catenaria anguillulae PL171 TaxID=765915 RepID=A0A1Y2I5S2_9FUNG|nr:pre-RNA processing PIH1/Nop17-domain-containing protein [Catenaria anguillulae PL171]
MSSTFQETNHLASLSSLPPSSPDSNPSDALANLPPELQQLLHQAAASGDLPTDPAALRDFVSAAAAGGTPQQDAQEIVPMKGYVIKTSLAKSSPVYPSGMKVFVNVTHSPYVPAPPVATDEEIKRAIADAPSNNKKPAWRVPMSLSDVRDDLDKAGRPCLVVDALVNTSVVHKSEHSPDFGAFVNELALSWVEAKHNLSVSRAYSLPHMQCKGDPAPHVIYRAKRAGIAESDAVKQTPMYRVRRSGAAPAVGGAGAARLGKCTRSRCSCRSCLRHTSWMYRLRNAKYWWIIHCIRP